MIVGLLWVKRKRPAYSSPTAPYRGIQTVTTILFSRILWDKFYNKKNKETYINQFLHFQKKAVLLNLKFFA